MNHRWGVAKDHDVQVPKYVAQSPTTNRKINIVGLHHKKKKDKKTLAVFLDNYPFGY